MRIANRLASCVLVLLPVAAATMPESASTPVDASANDVSSCRPLGEVIGESAVCIAGGKKRARKSALDQATALGASHIVWLDVRCHIGVGEKARARIYSCVPVATLEETYEDLLAKDAGLAKSTIAASEPVIRRSFDLDADATDLSARGYALIGIAGSSGTAIPVSEIEQKAGAVGAATVLLHTASRDVVEYQSVTTYSQTGPTFTMSSATATGSTQGHVGASALSARSTGSSSGTSITLPSGTTSSQMVPMTHRAYDTQVLFWRKRVAGPFGIHGEAIPPVLRAQLRRNTGVLVTAIEEESKAFFANVLIGDVVIRVGDSEVRSPAEFIGLTENAAGDSATLTVIRDGVEVVLRVD